MIHYKIIGNSRVEAEVKDSIEIIKALAETDKKDTDCPRSELNSIKNLEINY